MRTSLKLLDLFCGAGGCSDGYYQAGFNPTGVDYVNQANYPYEFIRSDFRDPAHVSIEYIKTFDFVHASPPCFAFLDSTGSYYSYPDHLSETRRILQLAGVPYVIENVPEAPLADPKITICGASPIFDGELRVIRHRTFEFSEHFVDPSQLDRGFKDCLVPEVLCPVHHPKIHTSKRHYTQFGKTDEWTDFLTVTGGGNSTLRAALDAMGYHRDSKRMIKSELNQAMPPAYTRYIGYHVKHLLFGYPLPNTLQPERPLPSSPI